MFAKIYVHCKFAGNSLLFLIEHIFIRFLSIISVTVYEVFQSPRGDCNMAMVPLTVAINTRYAVRQEAWVETNVQTANSLHK